MNIKNYILLLFILLSFQSNTSAQSQKRTVGLDIGGAYSYLTSYENSRLLGYSLGIHADVIKYDKWGITSGLYFQKKGGEDGQNYGEQPANLIYRYYQWSVPVTSSIHLGKKWVFHGGIYLGRNMPFELVYDFRRYTLTYVEKINDPEFYAKEEVRHFEWGSKFSLEFKLFDNISLAFTVSHAFQPFYIDKPESVLLTIADFDYIDIDKDFKQLLDNKMKKAKNAFYSIEVKTNLFKF